MTVEALTGAHAGSPAEDGDVLGNDTYETARTFESLGVSEELTPNERYRTPAISGIWGARLN